MIKQKIEVKERFILEALRSTGYDAYSAIYELIDNSIDAESLTINIVYNKDNKSLSISDDGKGMSLSKLSEIMNFGCDRTYSTTEIGYFGVGLKSSCLNLVDLNKEDSFIEIMTNDGVEQSIVKWSPINNPLDYLIGKYTHVMDNIGTTIIIHGVNKFSEQTLKKYIGVLYFPILQTNTIQIIVNDTNILYNDPLYRYSSLTEKNYVKATVSGFEIEINCCLINDGQEKHNWDIQSVEGKWSYAKGGLYIIYGGRYIDYGGTFGLKGHNPWDSRTRIEFRIPKELTDVFEMKFNKTNGISLTIDGKAKDKLDDLVRKLKDMFNWGVNFRGKKGESIASKDEKENLGTINEELNKSVERSGIKSLKEPNTIKEKIESPIEPKDKPDNIKPQKQRKAKIETKKLYELRTENMGSTNCFWHIGYENNVFIITLNEAHVFYRDIYRNMPDSSRKDIIYLLASMAYAEYETKFGEVNVNEEYFWEDYWSQVSLRLKMLISA
jgi:hypothetical protein